MFETITPDNGDQGSLSEFLIQVKVFLIQITFEGYLIRTEWRFEKFDFEPLHLELYRNAVREYVESQRFERLLAAVRDMGADKIADGGLGGAQLLLKRESVRVVEKRFIRFPTIPGFKRLLETIDVLLGSILDATGAGSALEELKDLAGLLPKRERQQPDI